VYKWPLRRTFFLELGFHNTEIFVFSELRIQYSSHFGQEDYLYSWYIYIPLYYLYQYVLNIILIREQFDNISISVLCIALSHISLCISYHSLRYIIVCQLHFSLYITICYSITYRNLSHLLFGLVYHLIPYIITRYQRNGPRATLYSIY